MTHSKPQKYQLPDFLSTILKQTSYERWLRRRAAAHVKRDKKRGNSTATNEAYKIVIHRAVIHSAGQDHYTGERLDWKLVGQYSNAESKAKGRHYKADLALLPSVDHVGDGLGEAEFKICAWRTNDAKNDLTHQEFVALCRRVVEMAKTTRSKRPIMTPDEERFMAFEGLLQWTQAVVTQSARVSAARDRQSVDAARHDPAMRHRAILAFHSECHFFAVAAHKLIEFRDWVRTFGLCATVDFSEISRFSVQDIRDLRNMREHVVDYFAGVGNTPTRWNFETPQYKADASSVVETMIGGRLDWIKFGAAAKRLLPKLLAEPIPYPPPMIYHSGDPRLLQNEDISNKTRALIQRGFWCIIPVQNDSRLASGFLSLRVRV